MTRQAIASLALTGLFTLTPAACSSNDSDAPAAPATTFAPATAEAAADTATAAQFASLIAESKSDWEDAVATVDEACIDPTSLPRCNIGYSTAQLVAETLQIRLTSSHNPDCKADPACQLYVGEPPTEIEGLIAETEAALQTYIDAYEAWSETLDSGCIDPLDPECEGGFAMDFALGQLSDKLDAWEPYL